MATRRDGQPPRTRVQIPENVSEFYVNSLNIAFTAWDFMLLFGSNTLPDTLTAGAQMLRNEIRVDAVVRMSPQHAKASLRALETVVAEYERVFGEIHIPPPEVPDANPS